MLFECALVILLLLQIVTIDRIECFASVENEMIFQSVRAKRISVGSITKSQIRIREQKRKRKKKSRAFDLRGGPCTEFKNTARTPNILPINNNNNN